MSQNDNQELTVWKQEVEGARPAIVHFPAGARLLKAQIGRNSKLAVWALVDPSKPLVKRALMIYGTGHPINPNIDQEYFDTVFEDNRFVWHVFVSKEEREIV